MSIRAFVALNFSVAATRRIAEEIERRKAPVAQAGAKVAWVPAANLHVTLKFLGQVPEESLEAVASRLRAIAGKHAPLQARAVGLGAFPSLERPRVLWVGTDAGDALPALQRSVEGALVELGFEKEERAFHPHVTVGRVQHPADVTACWKHDAELCASPIAELVVYESRTLAKGAEYVARARVPLGKGDR